MVKLINTVLYKVLKPSKHTRKSEFSSPLTMCHEVLKMRSHVLSSLLLKLFSVGAPFSLCSFSQRKGWQSKVTFEKCISLSARQSVLFPYRQPPPSARCHSTHTHTHTHLLPALWQWCPWLPPRLRALGRPLATSGPLNDTLAGCGVTRGPIKSQTQHQICHIHSCDELLDITLSPPDDRLSTPVSRWSIIRLSPKTHSSCSLSALQTD